MKRNYTTDIKQHFSEHSQIVMVSGPRQVGKTTLAQSIYEGNRVYYLNWDDFDDREIILQGTSAIAEFAKFRQVSELKPLIIFDEIHKYSKWKQLIKGFYDHHKAECHIIVTGSSRMDVYKKGGDSLMGRYFNYRLHPFSLSEINIKTKQINIPNSILLHEPRPTCEQDFQALLQWGGFPEPFIKRNTRFFNRWSRSREQQLLRQDIRDLSRVQELDQLEMLAILLKRQSGQLTSYSSLAKKVRVSVDTIRRWINLLESFYYIFSVRPWTKNIARSLLKEPKYYLWDWSQNLDKGSRNENFIASHLLKAVDYWTDLGFGNFKLHFVRDKEKRGVDFLVVKDDTPWILVEVKSSVKSKLSPNLSIFAKQLDVEHTFQVGVEGDFVNRNLFNLDRKKHEPVIVSAKTFLSQLV